MNKDVVEKAQLPQHLTNYKDGAKEATPAEIERVYNQIRRMCAQDGEKRLLLRLLQKFNLEIYSVYFHLSLMNSQNKQYLCLE